MEYHQVIYCPDSSSKFLVCFGLIILFLFISTRIELEKIIGNTYG